jgi:XTP/dITP diphosphohydrolase
MEILAATGNRHKLSELRTLLAPHGISVLGADDVGGIPDVVEDGETFSANACKKAVEIAAATGRRVMADDSGLEVRALGGEPGVYSARYAGVDATDAERMGLLLSRLASHCDRRARFVCVVAIATPAGVVGTAEGEVPGQIAAAPRGESGFGYDPIFVPEGDSRTFAEMAAAEKDAISHRANAVAQALTSGLLSPEPN